MALAVVTVAAGGMPVVDVTATTPNLGMAVTEAPNGCGVAVTKVVGKPGLAVTFIVDGFAAITAGANAFATAGDSAPIIGLWAQAFYDDVNKTTWFPFAGSSDGAARQIYVKTYNHQTGVWSPLQTSPGTVIATNPNTDSHGEPGAVMDQYGFVHVFFGAHNSAFKYSYTTNPRDPSAWTVGTDIPGTNTVANPVLCGGKIYLFTQGLNSQLTYFVGTLSPAGGVSSWSAEKSIVSNVSTPGISYIWIGNAIARGTKIYFTWTYAVYPAVYIADAYFGYLETTDGSLHNINSSTVVASGSLPINRAASQANFLVYQTPSTNEATVIPSFAFDTSDRPHVLYANGTIVTPATSAGTYILYDRYWNGAAWTTGVQIDSAQAGYFFSLPTLVQTPTGISAYWGHKNGLTEDAYTATYTVAGGWSAGTKIKAANYWPLCCFTPVTNASSQARVIFAENSTVLGASSSTVFGNLAIFAYGDQGFLNLPYGSPSGLRAHWPLDSATTNIAGNTTSDISGNNVTGALTGMVAGDLVAGQIGEGLKFVNTGANKIDFGNVATIKPAFPFTVSFWYKPSTFDAAYNNLFISDSNAAAYAGITIQASTNGSVTAFYGNNAGKASTNYFDQLAGTNILLNSGAWNFVTVRVASLAIRIRINGVPSDGGPDGSAAAIGYSSLPAFIGKNVADSTNGPSGPMDDIRMYGNLEPWQLGQLMWQGLQGHR